MKKSKKKVITTTHKKMKEHKIRLTEKDFQAIEGAIETVLITAGFEDERLVEAVDRMMTNLKKITNVVYKVDLAAVHRLAMYAHHLDQTVTPGDNVIQQYMPSCKCGALIGNWSLGEVCIVCGTEVEFKDESSTLSTEKSAICLKNTTNTEGSDVSGCEEQIHLTKKDAELLIELRNSNKTSDKLAEASVKYKQEVESGVLRTEPI